MKKLSRKGFTLIELLAIIVILAIIMIVTIPSVLNLVTNAKVNQFINAANMMADWTQKQYDLAKIGQADSAFTDVCSASNAYCVLSFRNCVVEGVSTICWGQSLKKIDEREKFDKYLTAVGLNPDDYIQIEIFFHDSETDGIPEKRACIILISEKDKGPFKNLENNGNPQLSFSSSGYPKAHSDTCP